MSVSVIPIKAFTDNYIWCLIKQNNCVVVDPGDAAPVLAYCQDNQLTLTAIIITHHHWDHTSGIDALLAVFPDIPVYGPKNKDISQITKGLSQDDVIELHGIETTLTILEVPGHTLDHIAYYGDSGLFCGDTLFSAGCGRLFEGTPTQMYESLTKLMALPSGTVVYCTHEYTLANIAFAEVVEPNNQELIAYKNWVIKQRAQNLPTLPSNMKRELAINPFLRCHHATIQSSVSHNIKTEQKNELETFALLRSWKDKF